MNMDERIARINELYHKSQAEGLTEEEKEEQTRLRKEYVASVRNNLKSQLDNIIIEKTDGSVVDLGKKYGGKTGGPESDGKDADGQEPDRNESAGKDADRQELNGEEPDGKDAGGKEPDEKAPETGIRHG